MEAFQLYIMSFSLKCLLYLLGLLDMKQELLYTVIKFSEYEDQCT